MIYKIQLRVPIVKNEIIPNGNYFYQQEIYVINELVVEIQDNRIVVFPKYDLIEILFYEHESEGEELNNERKFSATREYHYLVFILEKKINDNLKMLSFDGTEVLLNTEDEDFHGLNYAFVKDEIERGLHQLFIALNLSSPGIISFGKSILRIGNSDNVIKGLNANSIQESVQRSQKIEWPLLENVPIRQVFKWLGQHKGLYKGFSNSQVERALLALSNVVGTFNSIHSELMWSLIGIETLYGSTKNNVLEALDKNISVYLGHRSSYKKIIKQMYKIRSQFLHGSMNFEGVLLPDDQYFFDGSTELYDCKEIALIILVATLQKMALEERNGLNFIYDIKIEDLNIV